MAVKIKPPEPPTMLTMDYATVNVPPHKYACSTMSSETLSGSCGSRNNRIRTIRLVRPSHGPLPPPTVNCKHGPSLGFSVRGGREHGTGVFVSNVEMGSEAQAQGLRVGDQIIRINGFTLEDAVHKEVLQLISNHTHVTLKVRSVGMIPVKDRKTDSLSWQIVTDRISPSRNSPPLNEKLNDVRINIMVAPKSKLGCGICKGPDWKPGIFVQFTKEGGIAREAGLRPGDQILICNGVDFSDVPFNEAVSVMKSARQLSLVVRKGAGSELFPGESSGYNSSASSVTGDQSPSWSDSKRLSIVKEENLSLEGRLNHLEKYKTLLKNQTWDSWDEEQEDKPLFKPTIINVSATGSSTIHNNGSNCSDSTNNYAMLSSHYSTMNGSTGNYDSVNSTYSTIANGSTYGSTNGYTYNVAKTTNNNSAKNENEYCPIEFKGVTESVETKTVVVDVHRSNQEDSDKRRKDYTVPHPPVVKSPSVSSFSSLASKSSGTSTGSIQSSATSCSLSSAITQEILRRNQQKPQDPQSKPSIDDQIQMKKILKNVTTDQQSQHTRLMDEFKKAHQKMFKSPSEIKENSENEERRKNGLVQKDSMDRQNNAKASQELSQKLSERLSNLNLEDTQKNGKLGPPSTTRPQNGVDLKVPPPPPPPPQQHVMTSSPSTSTTISTLSSPTSSSSSTRSNTLKTPSKSLKNDTFTQSLNQAFESNTNTLRSGKKGPPVPVKYSVLSYRQEGVQKSTQQIGATNGVYQQVLVQKNVTQNTENNHYQFVPPPCPTPDYDTLSLASTTSSSLTTSTINQAGKYQNHILTGDQVEMQSLESFRLDQPTDVHSKPPNIYFQKRPLSASISNQSSQSVDSSRSKGNTTLTRNNRRPVSVTIGEYPTLRRQPSKLEFLQNGDQVDHRTPEDSLNTRLNSELIQTLNRSNLKKRTESMENLLGSSAQIKNQKNGTVRISLNMSKAFAKSTNDLTCLHQYDPYDTLTSPTNNRVTINVNQREQSRNETGQSKSSESMAPNGILKNGSGESPIQAAKSAHKVVSAQKSITFGEMPIVIKDKASSPT